MREPVPITSRLVEFHRFGGPQHVLTPDSRYIRTTGWDEPLQEVPPKGTEMLSHEEFQRNLNLLRYRGFGTAEQARAARETLAEYARLFLPLPDAMGDELLQIDLVTHAGELWAYPFEACFASDRSLLDSAERGLVLTRRIRGAFSDEAVPWPAAPRVLFAHAPVTYDLEEDLVNSHTGALESALAPWGGGGGSRLTVKEVLSADDLARACAEVRPAYVHILAHGAHTTPDPLLPEKIAWGLRLGYTEEDSVPPEVIASALEPVEGVPVVVTLAACDSANQGQPAYTVSSPVQELHRRGVPVVIGSQLPLTKHGSVVLVRSFYERLLRGEDVRLALHASRVALSKEEDAGHDWLSLVGYVRLPPEGYAMHLAEFGLRAELGMLKAAQNRADWLAAEGGSLESFAEVENQIRLRFESLERRKKALSRQDLIDECNGLMASARKRLAELLFRRAERYPERKAKDLADSRGALEEALNHYRSAYRQNIHNHWLGMQQLGLEAVLNGGFQRPEDWGQVRRAAELVRDAAPRPGEPGDFWSCGTLAEAMLLAPLAGQPGMLGEGRAAIALLKQRAAGRKDEEFALDSTRRQLNRYVNWWTCANGFLPGREDFSKDAARLVEDLD